MSDTPESIAYEEARQAIQDQRARLDNLRTRAATLLSAAAIVTSFLGAEALRDTTTSRGGQQMTDRSLECAEIVAIGSFVGVGLACLFILWPRRRHWLFGFTPAKLVRSYVDAPKRKEPAVIQRDLALHFGKHHKHNSGRLETLFWAFQIGAGFLGVEVLAWMIDLT